MTIIDVSWAQKLGQHLISLVFLAQKDIEIFLREKSYLSEIYFKKKIFDFTDIVDNQ